MAILKSFSDKSETSKSTVKIIPRHLQERKPVKSGDIAKTVLNQSFSPEQSSSVRRLEERMLNLILREKQG